MYDVNTRGLNRRNNMTRQKKVNRVTKRRGVGLIREKEGFWLRWTNTEQTMMRKKKKQKTK